MLGTTKTKNTRSRLRLLQRPLPLRLRAAPRTALWGIAALALRPSGQKIIINRNRLAGTGEALGSGFSPSSHSSPAPTSTPLPGWMRRMKAAGTLRHGGPQNEEDDTLFYLAFGAGASELNLGGVVWAGLGIAPLTWTGRKQVPGTSSTWCKGSRRRGHARAAVHPQAVNRPRGHGTQSPRLLVPPLTPACVPSLPLPLPAGQPQSV
ncbi:hypothetical protein DFH07DRAFT_969785 [Mycena maculata]|uniref:Uncharacterized protein n=1 Tax=Mycena maculata TaxID=230809 RepID=A0AAD7HUV1_9AGAR|nr:hypothetical protein DFH07DRAFT_969785 [Mycena maculata]